jgi:hypothetical protein
MVQQILIHILNKHILKRIENIIYLKRFNIIINNYINMEIQVFGKISNFCEITNITIKNAFLSAIYNYINLSNIRYQLLDSLKSLDVLKKEQLYVTPHIMGVNCLIVFMEYDGKKCQAIINKKDLKHYQNQVNVQTIKMYNFWYNHRYANDLYPLSIFDGKFILNENNLTYLILDYYVLNGNKMLTKNIINKLDIMNNLLPTINSGLDKEKTNFDIKMSGIYALDQLGDLVFNKIKNSKLKINGLIFLPERSGKTYIFINDIEFSQLRSNVLNTNISQKYVSLSVPAIPLKFSVKNQIDENVKETFVFKKTNVSDVYELYLHNDTNKIYLNIIPENKIGIAHIPDIKTSHYFKLLSNEKELFTNDCVFNEKFKKWMPII